MDPTRQPPESPDAPGVPGPPLLAANARVLASRWPSLAAQLAATPIPATHRVETGNDGEPVLRVGGVLLSSPAATRGDAVRWARSALGRIEEQQAAAATVIGLALGHHVEELAARFDGPLRIVEPDPAIVRLALATRDLSALLARQDVELDLDLAAGAEPAAAAAVGLGGRVGRMAVLSHAPSLLVAGGGHRRALERVEARAVRSGMRLRILVVSPTHGGSWPIAGYAARALARLGHDVRLVDLAPFHAGFQDLARFGARASRRQALESSYLDVLGDGVVAAAEEMQPDLVLALAQAPLGPRTLERLRELGAVRAMWFVEDFRRFDYWKELGRHYDFLFTIQDGECHEAMRAVCDARLAYLPVGCDPEIHCPVTLAAEEHAEFAAQVSFVGAGYWNRRVAFRRFLDLDFRIWGTEWEAEAALARIVQRNGARISTEDAVKIFAATDVNLNLHSSAWAGGVDPRGDFVNPRTFELAAAGAFQITDQRALLPALFRPGEEVAVARDVDEMRALTTHYLGAPHERATISAQARRRALADHTYERRMESLLGVVLARERRRFLGRARPLTIGDVAQREPGPLAEVLTRLDGTQPFTLDRVVAGLAGGTGALSEPEAILLFLHQFDELYLREYRA